MAYSGQLTFSGAYDNDTDPDFIYYNASIINTRSDLLNNGSGFTSDPEVRFLETRDVPIIKDASKYHFSIIRFTMNGPNKDLPIFIPVMARGAANISGSVDETIYSVSLQVTVGGTTFTQTNRIIYEPETKDTNVAPVPSTNTILTGQDISTRYYWVYTYSWWLKLVNKALADCMTALKVAAGIAADGTASPYITYNPTNNLFSIYCDRNGFGGVDRSGPNDFSLWFNNNMYGMFSNFQNTYYNTPASELDNLIYTGVVGPYQNLVSVPTGTPTPTAAKTYWIMTQDYESTSTLWSPIENIVFNSTLLPLAFENTGDPVLFGDGNTNTESTNSRPAFQPIITDVALPADNAHAYRELIYYAPQAEYRLSSFQRSKQTINQIDIQVFWKNRLDGKLYPVQMFNSSSVSVKIMFRRRGIFDYPHPAKGGQDL